MVHRKKETKARKKLREDVNEDLGNETMKELSKTFGVENVIFQRFSLI